MSDSDDTLQPAGTAEHSSPTKRRLEEHAVPVASRKRCRLDEDVADHNSASCSSTTSTSSTVSCPADGPDVPDMPDEGDVQAPTPPQPPTTAPLMRKRRHAFCKWDAAMANQRVDRRVFRRVGPYILGQKIGNSSVGSIVQYLAKKEGTDRFVVLKILTLCDENTASVEARQEEKQGKMMLHAELSMLTMLADERGVINSHGLLTDNAYEEEERADGQSDAIVYTGRICRRLILVLDCVWPHKFCARSQSFVNLQQYLIRVRKIKDCVALPIFRDIVAIVERFHERNIIHSDLKLAHIMLNKYTSTVTITNFSLGKYLQSDVDSMIDQRGSPAYISPEVLMGRPYAGKPIDVWSLGVMLYMMVFGQFPFYESSPALLFKKIKAADYTFPITLDVSYETIDLIRGMLVLNASQRLTAAGVRKRIDDILHGRRKLKTSEQAVPFIAPPKSYVSPFARLWSMATKLQDDTEQQVPVMATSKSTSGSGRGNKSDKKPFIRPSADIFVPNQPMRNVPTLPPLRIRSRPTISISQLRTMSSQTPAHHSPAAAPMPQQLPQPAVGVSPHMPAYEASVPGVYQGGSGTSGAGLAGQRPLLTTTISPASVQAQRRIVNNIFPDSSHSIAQQRLYQINEAYFRNHVRNLTPSRSFRPIGNAIDTSQTTTAMQPSVAISPELGAMRGVGGADATTTRPSHGRNSALPSTSSTANSAVQLSGIPISPLARPNATSISRGVGSGIIATNEAMAGSSRDAATNDRPGESGAGEDTPAAAAATTTLTSGGRSDSIQSLFNAFNEMFIRGRLPPVTGDLTAFDGCLTQPFCDKVVRWLLLEHGDHAIVEQLFQNSTDNSLQKVRAFLQRCGVQMYVDGGVFKLRRDQSLTLLLVLTYLMQATGYDMSYFWA